MARQFGPFMNTNGDFGIRETINGQFVLSSDYEELGRRLAICQDFIREGAKILDRIASEIASRRMQEISLQDVDNWLDNADDFGSRCE